MSADLSWHGSSDFNEQVKKFHDRYAREPKSEMTKARKLLELYACELRDRLKFCSRLEYTGSSYDGLKVPRNDEDSDLEFDIMVILRFNIDLQVKPIEPRKPGYVELLIPPNTSGREMSQWMADVSERNYLSAEKLANKFMSELARCLQQIQQEARDQGNRQGMGNEAMWKLEQLRSINDRIKLRRHGPAVQMDIHHLLLTPERKFYSVDMVPTIQISGRNGENEYYVAKPIKGASNAQNAWRRSFSLHEKKRLVTLDQGNGCRKQVLRILKVMRHRDTTLAPLTSYHLKTVMFRMTDELTDSTLWRSECMGRRLMDVIAQMEKELDWGVMPHYFLSDANLLDGLGPDAVFNLRQRLKRLIHSKDKMMKLLQ